MDGLVREAPDERVNAAAAAIAALPAPAAPPAPPRDEGLLRVPAAWLRFAIANMLSTIKLIVK